MAFENFFEFYLRINPLLGYGVSSNTAQSLDEAATLLDQAAQQFPRERSDLNFYRLRLAAQRQDVEGAIAVLDSALTQSLPFPHLHNMDGVLGSICTAPEIQP